MPSQTPAYKFPYPVGTDRVTDGDNAIQALAERNEAILAALFQAGTVVVPVVGQNYTFATVIFPRAFPGTPIVVATSQVGDFFATVGAPNVSGVDVGVFHPAGATTFNVSVQWFAFYPGAVTMALMDLMDLDPANGEERK